MSGADTKDRDRSVYRALLHAFESGLVVRTQSGERITSVVIHRNGNFYVNLESGRQVSTSMMLPLSVSEE